MPGNGADCPGGVVACQPFAGAPGGGPGFGFPWAPGIALALPGWPPDGWPPNPLGGADVPGRAFQPFDAGVAGLPPRQFPFGGGLDAAGIGAVAGAPPRQFPFGGGLFAVG
ncbi:MAG TPA: hypothetical protein VMT47_01390, partial [Polyangia bacterium]|nr:hypothetical protein [Polyangia bacterium]